MSSYSRLSGTVRWLWNSRPGNAGLAAPRPGTIPGSPAVTVPSLSGPPTGTRGHGKPHGTQNDSSASRCFKYPEVTGRTKPPSGDPAKVLRVGTPFTFPGVARLRRDAARWAQGVRSVIPLRIRWPPARGPRADPRTPTPAWVLDHDGAPGFDGTVPSPRTKAAVESDSDESARSGSGNLNRARGPSASPCGRSHLSAE